MGCEANSAIRDESQSWSADIRIAMSEMTTSTQIRVPGANSQSDPSDAPSPITAEWTTLRGPMRAPTPTTESRTTASSTDHGAVLQDGTLDDGTLLHLGVPSDY